MEELASEDQQKMDAVSSINRHAIIKRYNEALTCLLQVEEDELYREHAFLLIEAAVRSALDQLNMINLETELLAHAEEHGLSPGQGERPPPPPAPAQPPPKTFTINSKEEASKIFKTQPGWTMTVRVYRSRMWPG